MGRGDDDAPAKTQQNKGLPEGLTVVRIINYRLLSPVITLL
jgi:hypothetical protein